MVVEVAAVILTLGGIPSEVETLVVMVETVLQ
jgi:hypothetical protein